MFRFSSMELLLLSKENQLRQDYEKVTLIFWKSNVSGKWFVWYILYWLKNFQSFFTLYKQKVEISTSGFPDLYVLEDPEHNLTIFRKCLSMVSVRDACFAIYLTHELLGRLRWNFTQILYVNFCWIKSPKGRDYTNQRFVRFM